MKNRIVKTSALFLATVFILASTACRNKQQPLVPPDPPEDRTPMIYSHVAIIGVDGGGNFFNKTDTPNMDRIFSEGATTYSATTEIPSSSTENWTSMFLGVGCDIHGCPRNFDSSFTYPSVFRLLRQKDPNADMCSFVCWETINSFIEWDIGLLDYRGKNDKNSDRLIAEKAEKTVLDFCPELLFIQFNASDGYGHDYGFGLKEELDYITVLDEYIGRIYQAYDDMGILDETLFIVTADHGGTHYVDENGMTVGSHGGTSPEETTVFLGIAGKTVANIDLGAIKNRDVAAITAAALGIEIPEIWTSKVPEGLFTDR